MIAQTFNILPIKLHTKALSTATAPSVAQTNFFRIAPALFVLWHITCQVRGASTTNLKWHTIVMSLIFPVALYLLHGLSSPQIAHRLCETHGVCSQVRMASDSSLSPVYVKTSFCLTTTFVRTIPECILQKRRLRWCHDMWVRDLKQVLGCRTNRHVANFIGAWRFHRGKDCFFLASRWTPLSGTAASAFADGDNCFNVCWWVFFLLLPANQVNYGRMRVVWRPTIWHLRYLLYSAFITQQETVALLGKPYHHPEAVRFV